VAEKPIRFIADTNIVSNRGNVEGNANLSEWLRRHAALLYLSVLTVAEMRRGLILLEDKVDALTDRKVKARERQRLDWKWARYNQLTVLFANRMEPIDITVAEKWAEISVRFPSLRDADKAISATALAKGFGIATENLGHFRRLGVVLVNPFDPRTWDDDWDDDPVASLLGPKR